MKHKWKVSEAPTGRYRSFERRSWPSADYENGKPAAFIQCVDEYQPGRVKTRSHAPLLLRIADYSVTPFKWRLVTAQYNTISELKVGLIKILDKYPHFIPKE